MITDTVCEEDPNDWGDPDKHKNVRTQGTDPVLKGGKMLIVLIWSSFINRGILLI